MASNIEKLNLGGGTAPAPTSQSNTPKKTGGAIDRLSLKAATTPAPKTPRPEVVKAVTQSKDPESFFKSLPTAPVTKKESTLYTMDPKTQRYMKSTAAPIDDTWSVQEFKTSPAMVQPAPGGGTQYTVYEGCDPQYTAIQP